MPVQGRVGPNPASIVSPPNDPIFGTPTSAGLIVLYLWRFNSAYGLGQQSHIHDSSSHYSKKHLNTLQAVLVHEHAPRLA